MWEGVLFRMRILLGLGRGLAFLSLACAGGVAFGCDQLPADQPLWVRLSSPVSTFTAKVGDPVHAVLTQDVSCSGEVGLPMGTAIEGEVRRKRKVGWGIHHETAALELQFDRAVVEGGATIEIAARVEEVENAREAVKNGVIQGVLSSDTFQGRINSRLIHLPTWNPYSDLGLIIYKATFPIFPEPEIYYPAGTDLRLKTTAPVTWLPQPVAFTPTHASAEVMSDSWQADGFVDRILPRPTTKKAVDADVVNLVFLGSAEQVQAAFREAGWQNSDPVSRASVMKNLYALLNNSAYSQQPMTTFLLNGKPQDMSWQKGLNSYGKRDHLRIWQWSPEGTTDSVWLSSCTRDTSAVLSVKYKNFVHHIAPDIDDERAKVIRDLNFAGCVESVRHVSHRGSVTLTQNATGDLIRTDGSIAVVRLKDCEPMNPGLNSNAGTNHFRPGNHVFRYVRKQILTFRNDIWRANIIYGMYDVGRMAFNALRRSPALPPVQESPTPTSTIVPVVAQTGEPAHGGR